MIHPCSRPSVSTEGPADLWHTLPHASSSTDHPARTIYPLLNRQSLPLPHFPNSMSFSIELSPIYFSPLSSRSFLYHSGPYLISLWTLLAEYFNLHVTDAACYLNECSWNILCMYTLKKKCLNPCKMQIQLGAICRSGDLILKVSVNLPDSYHELLVWQWRHQHPQS